MPNISHKTVPVALRLDLKVYNIIKRRSDKQGLKVGEYLRRFLEYDANRKR